MNLLAVLLLAPWFAVLGWIYWRTAPAPFAAARGFDIAALVGAIESIASAFGYPARRLASGAGHDAVYVARTCPAAMVFVPCEKGISHNEIENADPVHLHAGTNVMLHAVLARANR